MKHINFCRACQNILTNTHSSSALQTYHCYFCGQFQLEHNVTKAPTQPWKEDNISQIFLDALDKRRRIQANSILRKWSNKIQEPALDYACGCGVFLEVALQSGLKIKGADLQRVGVHAEDILQVDKPWGTELCKGFKTVIMLDVIEHNVGLEQFLSDLKNYGVKSLIIKVPNSNGPSAIAARLLMRIGKPSLWETLNLVGDAVPHYTFFSTKSLKLTLDKSGYNILHNVNLCEFGTELPERLRSPKKSLSIILRVFGFFVSVLSFLWCDNITVFAQQKSK